MDMEGAIQQLQETVIVMAGLQARQAELLKGHSEWLEQHGKALEQHEKWWARHKEVMAEMEDKLNGLIGYVEGLRPPPKTE